MADRPDPGSLPEHTTTRATPVGPLAASGTPAPSPRSYWVVEGRLAGGAYPYDNVTDEGDAKLAVLVGAGFDAFVDLTEHDVPSSLDSRLRDYRGSPSLPGDVALERRPIPDLDVPTVEAAEATLDLIDELLDNDRTVYVHCWGGVGRTGVIVGAWLIRHGAATPESVFDVLDVLRTADIGAGVRPAPEMPVQREFLRRLGG